MTDDSSLPLPDIREARLYRKLGELGIPWRTVEHAAVFTVAESSKIDMRIEGVHTKNLFLKDAKGGLWLAVVRASLRVDLKALAKTVNAPRFSFGSADLLIATLGIAPGSVNPFALMNDEAGKVTCVLDAGMMGTEPLNFHPMRNDRTTALAPEDLLRFLRASRHEPRIVAVAEI